MAFNRKEFNYSGLKSVNETAMGPARRLEEFHARVKSFVDQLSPEKVINVTEYPYDLSYAGAQDAIKVVVYHWD
jgi:hypothetical protein